MKRFLDILISSLILILNLPLFALIALLIKIDDGNEIIYKASRIGLNGKPFRMFKFRTMVKNAEKLGGPSTADDDPRITSVGKFLRKFKLDELPQLFNVLTGEMSLVGPRPEVALYVDMFNDKFHRPRKSLHGKNKTPEAKASAAIREKQFLKTGPFDNGKNR